jgi:hypothetical protein
MLEDHLAGNSLPLRIVLDAVLLLFEAKLSGDRRSKFEDLRKAWLEGAPRNQNSKGLFTSLYISLHLFTSLYISLHLFTSLYISLHLFTSLYISLPLASILYHVQTVAKTF